jgi:hypothetical protein
MFRDLIIDGLDFQCQASVHRILQISFEKLIPFRFQFFAFSFLFDWSVRHGLKPLKAAYDPLAVDKRKKGSFVFSVSLPAGHLDQNLGVSTSTSRPQIRLQSHVCRENLLSVP